MEQTILGVLKLKLLDRCGLAMRGNADQMMPAQDLMKNNAIGKTAKPKAENNPGPNEGLRPHYYMFMNHLMNQA